MLNTARMTHADVSLEVASNIPAPVLVDSCLPILHIYTVLVDYNAHILFQDRNQFLDRVCHFVNVVKRTLPPMFVENVVNSCHSTRW